MNYRYDVVALLTVFLLQNGSSVFAYTILRQRLVAATDARAMIAFSVTVFCAQPSYHIM